MRIFLIQGFRLFDSSIDIVLTFEFGHDIMILKWQFSIKSIILILNQHFFKVIMENELVKH